MSLISIVIPVEPSHNQAGFLGVCLKSISAQTLSNNSIEVIIIGDGCRIREELFPGGMQCLVHNFDRQGGVLKARNKAVELSHGDLITFLDADCVVADAWLESLVRGLGGEKVAGASGKIIGFDGRDVYKDRVYSESYVLPCSGMGNIIFKKSVLKEIGLFDENLCFGAEEADLCWRVYLKGYRIRHADGAIAYHTTIRDIRDFFLYGIATRLLTVKYRNILRFSPLPELKRLARHPGLTDRTNTASNALFSLMKPLIVAAGYFQRTLLESCRLIPRVIPASGVDDFLSKTALTEFPLAFNSKKIAKPNYVIWWETENGCVIKDLRNHQDYVLNKESAAMWMLMVEGNPKESIVGTLVSEFDVSSEVLAEDFDELVQQFVDSGILIAL